MDKKFYITTPIYYTSGDWHIGHCYTTIICDAIARFKRMEGMDVFFLTGTDEHGQKIEKAAQKAGIETKKFVDEKVEKIKNLWKLLDVKYDKFIRTTDKQHEEIVQKIFKTLYDKGEIYKDSYEGLYCRECEAYWTESQLKDGKCPDCGRPVEKVKEENYFFRLSKYGDRLIKYYEENPNFIQPKSRQNEMINNFIRPNLQDISVSRSSFKWGVPVPFDDKHVIYVWIDALSNYITALGYGTENDSLYKKFWPADVHMVGKEIVRFHTIIWPAILMALDLPLPKQVYGHGWLLIGGEKMSKSKGNTADPLILSGRYGVDSVRYYVLREVPFGSDGEYTLEAFLNRFNTDLANDLGNLASRTTAMIEQYFDGIVPKRGELNELDHSLIDMTNGLYEEVKANIANLQVSNALSNIFKVASRANKYIDETTPWILNKNGDKERLGTVLYNLADTIRVISILLSPFITTAPKQILNSLGIKEVPTLFEGNVECGKLKEGTKVTKCNQLFPRFDIEKELTEVDKLLEQNKMKKEEENNNKKEQITIDDFAKTELKVGKVISCEKVEGADKLLKETVDLGNGDIRTIVSGIAKSYTPEEMVGKKVVIVSNLKPAKLRGIESQGMVLCAVDEKGNPILVSPEKEVNEGSEVR